MIIGPYCPMRSLGQITIRTFLKPLSDLEILLVKIKLENEKLVELGKKKNEENGWNYKTVDNTGLDLTMKVTRSHLRSFVTIFLESF